MTYFVQLERLYSSLRPSGQTKPYHTAFSLISGLTSRVPQGDMKSLNPELSIYGSTTKFTRTDTVFLALFEVRKGAVVLRPNNVLLHSLKPTNTHYLSITLK